MLHFHFFKAVYVLFGATAMVGASYSFLENQIPLSMTPQFEYTSSGPSAVFSGYSYQTLDFNGGASNVVFATGPDSAKNLEMRMRPIAKAGSQMSVRSTSTDSFAAAKLSYDTNNVESKTDKPTSESTEGKSVIFPSFYGRLEIPSYPLHNPYIHLFYQSPFAPTFGGPLVVNTDLQNSFQSINEKNHQTSCTKSRVGFSKNTKTIPASEYVTNSLKNDLLKEPLNEVDRHISAGSNEKKGKIDKDHMKSENVTSTIKPTTNNDTTTMKTGM